MIEVVPLTWRGAEPAWRVARAKPYLSAVEGGEKLGLQLLLSQREAHRATLWIWRGGGATVYDVEGKLFAA